MPRLFLNGRCGIGSFRRSRTGNVGMIFALSLLPMIGMAGLGIDYGMALNAKAKLDNAADAAALSAVATAKAYIADNAGTQVDPGLTSNAIAAGVDRATRAFAVNAGAISYTATPTPTIGLSRSGQTFSALVTYQTASTNNFGRLFGQSATKVAGTTAATADIPSYLDFYLLIDVSASMGLPSTLTGQNYLAANNGGCQFACHFPDQNTGYKFAVANAIQLRSGAVNTAVCGLLGLAAQPLVKNQYRVGLYPFVTQMATLASISSNIASLQLSATCNVVAPTAFTALLDTGTTQLPTYGDLSTGTGSGGTHFETSLASLQATISPYGDGSSAAKSRPFVFLITDGMENTQYFALGANSKWYYPGGTSTYQTPLASWWTGTNPLAMDPSLCAALKKAGATVSVLYIPYTTLTVTNQNTWETQQADAAVPALPSALRGCATAGFFYTANTPADINAALAAMFNQAVQVAHIVR
jgi:Flp pilus assembly protein TadG